ncbi:pyridoxamine 5'-phosphate oxidase family protein [Jiangella endophytica]|uniref:pyridoxamine 5'-phosphate oxidase family protein n=1 Tax=Jiangella endophytica TaxID=1623398 RepID=UPI000E3472AD|nr:pyridoxamine 5'-phosphate oxidase family protein [Jiangella endophytica]
MTTPTSDRNLDGYGAPLIPWAKVRARLDAGVPQAPGDGGPNRHTCWLATTWPDGRPHVMPLGALWIDGAFYFTSGPGTRKSRNLAADPRCAITVALDPFDVVLEGAAERVTDDATLRRVRDAFAAEGWEPTVEGEAFTAEYSAPSAGPPPWYVYRLVPSTAFALGTEDPFGATRFTF